MSSEGGTSGGPETKWYVQCADAEIRGPCDHGGLKSLLDMSIISGASNVWCDGMDAWSALSSVDELKDLLDGEAKASSVPTEGDSSHSKTDVPNADASTESADTSAAIVPEAASADDATTAVSAEEEARIRKREKKRQYMQRKRMKIESGKWVESAVSIAVHKKERHQRNLSVYVSNLPDDTTAAEVAQVFKRAGVIKIDPLTTLPKIKLYTDDSGKFKNDARVTFVNKESVDFAIRYLDNYHFREDCVIHVEAARYDPQKYSEKSASPLSAEEMRKRYLAAKYEQDRLQSWTEDIDDGSGRRIVICKPMFSQEDAWEHEAGSKFYDDLREEVVAEITKFVPVEKVTPIARHPQGVVCVKLKTSADAEIFISKFQDRVFDGQRLQVYFFDGKTDLQAQALPSKTAAESFLAAVKSAPPSYDAVACDWIDDQSSDEEFEVKTE
ncbi:RNA recognition motif-containing protein [Babesia ovata]|uniref:RNA recognition motif-containing protein n=1 Tax=Babesia ovata TaxID=189622 RepID=A0A2H6KBW2_9APIC|nr:RNA recognition motif-containing protein [Babesia ovata]GBE60449.1 RNA recognition motif-containing protein [Babesia ovata]